MVKTQSSQKSFISDAGIPCFFFFFFFYLGFLSRTFTIHRTAGKGGGYLFNYSLPLPAASQTLRHQAGDYCREITSVHSQQPDSNREPLVFERKSLTISYAQETQFFYLRKRKNEMQKFYMQLMLFKTITYLIHVLVTISFIDKFFLTLAQLTYFSKLILK